MSSDTRLPFPTTDAMEWVRAFREANPDCNVGDDVMLGWFANAIEHGRGPDPVPTATDTETLIVESDGDDRHVLSNGVVIYGTRGQAERCAAALSAVGILDVL